MITTKVKIYKQDEVFHVNCHRRKKSRPARDCYTCSKFIDIDPVKSEITCRED